MVLETRKRKEEKEVKNIQTLKSGRKGCNRKNKNMNSIAS